MSGDVVSEGIYYDHHTDTGGHTTSGGRVFGVTPLLYADCESYGCQPRVVIDPENREQVDRLMEEFWDGGARPWEDLAGSTRARMVSALTNALRSLIEPPRPDEPTGLGAVVEDMDGKTWIRVSRDLLNPWLSPKGDWTHWDAVAAVRVLSDGVTA